MKSLRRIVTAAAKAGLAVRFVSLDGKSETRRSWESILEAARRRAEVMAQDEVLPGDRVVLMGDTTPALVETLVAVNLRGAIPIIIAPPRPNAKEHHKFIEKVVGDTKARRVYIDHRYYHRNVMLISRLGPVTRRLLPVEESLNKCAEAPESEIALIQYSSGSTRDPRGVIISQAGFGANLDAIAEDAAITKEDVVVSWLPLYHDMGLVAGLFGGPAWMTDSVLMDPMTFIRRPSRWLKAIAEYKGTISMAPNFAYEYCLRLIRPREIEGLDLSSWRVCWNGAEMVLASTIQKFENHFAQYNLEKNVIVPCYGAAEGTLKITSRSPRQPLLMVSIARDSLAHGVARIAKNTQDAVTVVSVGHPGGNTSIRIVDEDRSTLPDWQVGEIEITGTSVSSGYYGISDESFQKNGSFLTGDLGFVVDGELFVTGRRKELIIVDGRNLFPFDLEWSCREVMGPSCRNVAAFGVTDEFSGSERVIIAVEVTPRNRPQLELYRELERRLVALSGTTKIDIVEIERLPLTTSGKVQRGKTKELYDEGLYSVPWVDEVA